MPKKKKLESVGYWAEIEQANAAELLEFVLDRAEKTVEGVFKTDISIHVPKIRKLLDSFSSKNKSRYAPASRIPLSAPWEFLLSKSALSEKEVAVTLTFAAMHFGAVLEKANLWPGFQEFEDWKAALKRNSSKANKAKRAKSDERQRFERDLAKEHVAAGRSPTKAAKLIREQMKQLKSSHPSLSIRSARTIFEDVKDLFPMPLRTKPATIS
jgi:hypothetical protein